jgi:hypothetical protein
LLSYLRSLRSTVLGLVSIAGFEDAAFRPVLAHRLDGHIVVSVTVLEMAYRPFTTWARAGRPPNKAIRSFSHAGRKSHHVQISVVFRQQ